MTRRRLRGFWWNYWPLLVLPVVAVLLDLALVGVDEAWTVSDWVTNVVLGGVTPVGVGILLARRQTMIQEALADLELTEKVAMLSSAGAELRDGLRPGRTLRALYDARAGLTLVRLAREPMQREYLGAVTGMLSQVERGLRTSLTAYLHWTADDWAAFRRVVAALREHAQAGARRSALSREAWTDSIGPTTEALMNVPGDRVPFEAFREHFTRGPDRIRVALDWDRLAALVAAGAAEVRALTIDLQPYGGTAELDAFAAPWYTADGAEVAYDHGDAVPLGFAGLAEGLGCLSEDRRARVEAIRSRYAQSDGRRIELVLATWALPGGRRLVLDGNHRLAALAGLVGQGCPVTVREFRIVTTGPAPAPELVPDLAHHRAAAESR